MFRMGNMFVSSFLWFHGTKEKRAVKKGGALGEGKVPHAPPTGAQNRPSICKGRKQALRNGKEGNYSTQGLLSCSRKSAGKLCQSRDGSKWGCMEPQQTSFLFFFFSAHWHWFGLKAWQEAWGCQATLSCWGNEHLKCKQSLQLRVLKANGFGSSHLCPPGMVAHWGVLETREHLVLFLCASPASGKQAEA